MLEFSQFFDFSEYFRTSEKCFVSDPKFLNTKFLQNVSSPLSNPLLCIELINFSVSLVFHIHGKKKTDSQQGFLITLLSIISIACYERKIQKSLQSHKFFTLLMDLTKELLAKSQKNTQEKELLNIIMEIFAKVTYKNKNNIEYLFKKGLPKLFP